MEIQIIKIPKTRKTYIKSLEEIIGYRKNLDICIITEVIIFIERGIPGLVKNLLVFRKKEI